MDTFLLIVILAILVGALLKKYRPDTFNNVKDKVTSLIRTK